MPWTKDDVDRHKKGLTDKQKETWVKVANAALKRCLGEDRSQDDCEGSAIRQANKVTGSMKEYKAHTTSTNDVLITVNAIDVGGEAVPVAELVAAYEEQRGQGQGVGGTRQGDGGADACVCPECGHEVEHEKGTPCNEMECPECGVAMVGKEEEVSEETSKADISKARELLEQALVALGEKEIAEVELAESASGHAIALAETQAATGGPRAPLLMNVALIRPGWGNKKDNHYYSREVLARDAKVFEGVKMYTADHRPDQKSVRTEVSVIKQITGFTDDGAPIAQVAVHDPDFAEATRNRAKLGTLNSLECSILATGRTKKGKAPDGEKGNIVEAITSATSVDWVTKAGAGGHALNLAENNAGGVNMDKEKIQELLSESELPPEAQERLAGAEYEDESAVKEAILQEKEKAQEQEEPQKLEEAEITKLLSETNLPSASKKRLARAEYEDESALREAILAEVEYVKTLTGSGSPFAQGGGTAPGEEQMSEADYDVAYADILRRHGVYMPQRQEVSNA